MGDIGTPEPVLVRIHSQCLTGDVFHSLRCDCRAQLELALETIAREGRGLLIYEQQEGRGIGLLDGGAQVRWNPNGRELFYTSLNLDQMAVDAGEGDLPGLHDNVVNRGRLF